MDRVERKAVKKRTKELMDRKRVTGREVLLLLVAAISGGLAIYSARDNTTALGLLDQPALADSLTVVTNFRTDVLTREAVLRSDVPTLTQPFTQEAIAARDPNAVPQVTEVRVENTRIGGEVALFWTRPDGADQVTMYRRDPSQATPIVVVEGLAADQFIDSGLTDGLQYTYTIQATASQGAAPLVDAPSIQISPIDTIAPAAPTDLVVAITSTKNSIAVQLTWQPPADSDVDTTEVYRSSSAGVLGDQIASIAADADPTYTDTAVDHGQTYYYALVTQDTTGNRSSNSLSVATPGNSQPFTQPASFGSTIGL